jgi:hypothetical protein
MLTYEKFMLTFKEKNMKKTNPVLSSIEKMHILVIHDKCLFYANDNRLKI